MREILRACRSILIGVFVISGVVNVLMLTGSLFMMQIYDRVLASQSVPTLIVLSLIAIGAYLFQGILDIVRTRILALVGERVDHEIGPKIHAAIADLPLRVPRSGLEALQPLRDLDTIRGFLGGPGPLALFDTPWVPIYLAFLYVLHPSVCYMTIVGIVVLTILTAISELVSKTPAKQANEAVSVRNVVTDQSQRNAEVVRAMGFLPAITDRWDKAQSVFLEAQRTAAFRSGILSGLSKTFRLVLQSAILALAAYLVIEQELSAGGIIAATILAGRAMAPIDHAIAAWKGFVGARLANERLRRLLAMYPDKPPAFALPPPKQTLVVDQLVLTPPGAKFAVVKRVSFALKAGQALGVIGQSASGKTSLIRGLIGLWTPVSGKVVLDGSSIDQWTAEALGPSIGYLPQDVQLFDGTIAENIARFQKDANPIAVIAAAEAAGFHEHVISFENGYDQQVGQSGAYLSAGQRQRLGLARALYGNPFIVVMDEPNANLDAVGEAAVTKAIQGVKHRGGIAIVVAHRPSAIIAVDLLAAMKNGEIVAFGPRDEVLQKVTQAPRDNVVQHPASRPEPPRIITPEDVR